MQLCDVTKHANFVGRSQADITNIKEQQTIRAMKFQLIVKLCNNNLKWVNKMVIALNEVVHDLKGHLNIQWSLSYSGGLVPTTVCILEMSIT